MAGRLTLVERFFAKVDRDGPIPAHAPELGPCWLWQGAPQSSGYGVIRIEGVLMLAHRVAFWIAHGRTAPIDLEVAHRCDVRLCCRPSHLFVASHLENMRDAAAKGRLSDRPCTRDERGRYTSKEAA